MPGPLKTLFLALRASEYMQGVSLAFGEEMVNSQEFPLPLVCMVPRGGPITVPDFMRVQDPDTGEYVDVDDASVPQKWGVDESIDLFLWATSNDPSATPIDETDAAEALGVLVCSAFEDQRAMTDRATGQTALGLNWIPSTRRWQTMAGAVNRFGRALVISVRAAIPMVAPPGPEATVETTQFTLGPLNRVPG